METKAPASSELRGRDLDSRRFQMNESLPSIIPVEGGLDVTVSIPDRMPDELAMAILDYVLGQHDDRDRRAADVILLAGQLCPDLSA
jgi:hypothetical protein